MTSTGHFSVKQGKRVLVVMKSGHHIIAKFKEGHANLIEFYDHDDIAKADVRTLSIYKTPAS